MFNTDMIKPAIYLAIITALIAFRQWDVHTHYQRGYDAAQVEIGEQSQKELLSSSNKFKEELATAQHEAEHFRKIAVLLQNQKPVVITKWKEKVIYENPDCNNLAGFSVMWNESLERFNL